MTPNATAESLEEALRNITSITNERLTIEAFSQLSGQMAGYSFVKVVCDRRQNKVHFINNARYSFHADFIAENLLGISKDKLHANIDEYNNQFYLSSDLDRRFFLGILAYHKRADRKFMTLETVEIDNMNSTMILDFLNRIKVWLDPSVPVLFKPANHMQETTIKDIDNVLLPRIYNHELFATASYIPLNAGSTRGRLRIFKNEQEFKNAKNTVDWYDIVVMPRVPDDIPRIAGIINSQHTTPLSHTNVLATGWKIPNSIQIGFHENPEIIKMDGMWVNYSVTMDSDRIQIEKIERPVELAQRPQWAVQSIRLEEPETINTPIVELNRLRLSDRFRYGTKAANLGELCYILENGSERLLGFYRIKRPPRANLLPYLARFLKKPEIADASVLAKASQEFLREKIQIPRGIAIPFSVMQTVLESSPKIQQAIGKLKMALELNAREIEPLCLQLQLMIRTIRIPDQIRDYIDIEIANTLGGVSSFVVRSSSNAEDLDNFSAAGMYESIIHVETAEKLFQAIRDVWASQVSARSVRLLQQVGISLDDCYMGVIVQEEVKSGMGGVLVTTNPMNRSDFRNVYINVSPKSAVSVVQGAELPLQYLFNTVEGGGRTLSIGDAREDLSENKKDILQDLSFVGRLLQSHFSKDYTFSAPLDIEWVASDTEGTTAISIVQLRPYSK